MPYLETYYDYDIHRECFRVSDSASYVHTTDTILKLVDTEMNVINYFTATFSLDVIRNLGDGQVAIYDNEDLIELVNFNENTSKITDLTLDLNYDVPHNIVARYLGNDECLSSKSMSISLSRSVPVGFDTTLEFLDLPEDGVISNPQSQSLTLWLRDNEGLPIEGATLLIYINDDEPFSITTDSEGQGILYAVQHLPTTFGIHNLKARFDTTSHHFGSEIETTLYVGYQVTMTPTLSKYIVGQTPHFAIEAITFNDAPIVNKNVTLWKG